LKYFYNGVALVQMETEWVTLYPFNKISTRNIRKALEMCSLAHSRAHELA